MSRIKADQKHLTNICIIATKIIITLSCDCNIYNINVLRHGKQFLFHEKNVCEWRANLRAGSRFLLAEIFVRGFALYILYVQIIPFTRETEFISHRVNEFCINEIL